MNIPLVTLSLHTPARGVWPCLPYTAIYSPLWNIGARRKTNTFLLGKNENINWIAVQEKKNTCNVNRMQKCAFEITEETE